MHRGRYSVALFLDQLDRQLVDRLLGVERRDGAHAVMVETSEQALIGCVESLDGTEDSGCRRIAVGNERQSRVAEQCWATSAHHAHRRRGRIIQIIDDDHCRATRR